MPTGLRESDAFMNWGEIIITLILDLILTVFFYLLVPVIFCIRKKSMTKKQIKKVIIINGVCVCLFFGILVGRVTAAVFLWSWVGKKIMERVLLVDEEDEQTEENLSQSNAVNIPVTTQTETNLNIVQPFAPKNEISFCRKCGTKLLKDSQYCRKCGTKVHENSNNN